MLAVATAPVMEVRIVVAPESHPIARPEPEELLTAALYGDLPAITKRLDAGDDVNMKDPDGSTPLMTAASACHPQAVKLLLKRGANVEEKWSFNQDTALLRAASCGDVDTIKAVLAAKPDVRAKREDGTTALMQVVASGDLAAAQALVAAGADLGDRDEYGNTLLHAAAGGRGFAHQPIPEFVRWLIAKKVDLNARGLGGTTPLMAAIVGHQGEAMQLLLAAGADRKVKSHSGDDAVQFAEQLAPELLPLLNPGR